MLLLLPVALPTSGEKNRACRPLGFWLVSSVNVLLLDTVAAVSLIVLLHGPRTSLHLDLAATHQLLCTGYSRRLSTEKAEALGAAALAFKPLTRTELAPMIRRVLDDHSRRAPVDPPA